MLFLSLIRRFAATFASLGVIGVLVACSPVFDWRDVLPEQAPFAIVLPGKPAEMTRNINLDGVPVKMKMIGARAGGLAFTAAWAKLSPPDDAKAANDHQGQVQKALAAMQAGMIQNISGEVLKREPRNIELQGPQGDKAGLLPAVFIDATGKAQKRDVRMQAMFAAVGSDIMQFVVVGESFSAEAAATFFESVRARVQVRQSS